jgi:hypothetical protein
MHDEHTSLKSDVRAIKDAFPKNEDGQHDFDGHHDDHATRRDVSKWFKSTLAEAAKKIFSGAAWATFIFLLYATWEAIKNEAKK